MEVNILLFDDFDTMDAFGPAEVFGSSPQHPNVFNRTSSTSQLPTFNTSCDTSFMVFS